MEGLSDFHFLRPLWLLAILPLIYLCYLLWQQRLNDTGLEKYIDQHLLKHLSLGENGDRSRLPFIALFCIWLITVLALAGPTWKQIPQPLFSSESAVVIVLDLSPSMRAEDSKPSRIIRAHLKIQDFLSRRKDGLTALIVFAGEAYIVTPLTDDTKTISNLLPTLKPGILPLPGSNTEMALSLTSQLVNEARLKNASILLITDNIDEKAGSAIQKLIPDYISLTILGIGTDEGAPIPNNGDFLKDKQGDLIIAKRNSETMENIAKKVNGYYLPMQNDSSDIDFYYAQLENLFVDNTQIDEEQRQYDRWHEFAPILLLFFTPFLLLFFRRGLIISAAGYVLLSASIMNPTRVYADSWWDSLWKNNDQKAASHYRSEDYGEAAKQFDNRQWKGSAQYKNQDYEAALNAFSQDESAIGDYNRGNALAQLKRYDEAIDAYDKALEKDRSLKQAKTNKELVKQLKKKQEQEQQDNQQQSSDKNQKDKKQQQKNNKETGEQKKEQDQPSDTNKNSPEDKSDSEKSDSQKEEKQTDQSEKNTNKNGDKKEINQKIQAKLSPEEKQALEQWLRKVPDDPSGLLKRKFEYEYQKRRQLYQEGKWDLPENDAHQRY